MKLGQLTLSKLYAKAVTVKSRDFSSETYKNGKNVHSSNAWELKTQDIANSDAGLSHHLPVNREKFAEDEVKSGVDVPKYSEKSRPTVRRMSEALQTEIDDWFISTREQLGKFSTTEENKVKRLLLTYQDLNSADLGNLSDTDLYVHNI